MKLSSVACVLSGREMAMIFRQVIEILRLAKLPSTIFCAGVVNGKRAGLN
jgi:hypothetical protein